jgi:glycosyltransferase involved in cell wall biosynthesis
MQDNENKLTEKKLRIAMICDPIGEYKAGAIVSVIRFSKLLIDRGHHVVFIGAKTKDHNTDDYIRGIKTYRYRSLPLPKSGGWHLAFPTISEIKKVLRQEKIDLIHVILPMPGAIVAIKAAKSLGIKIVAHSHSQPENLFMDAPKFLRPSLDGIWNTFLAWLYSKGDAIVYPSIMAFTLLKHLTSPDKKSVVISNGVNTDEYKPTEIGDFYSRFEIPTDTTKIVYVGRLFPEKSVDTLIKAMPYIIEQNPHMHLMIVGGGHLREKLEKLSHDLHMEKHISFLGLVSDEDKVLAYNAGDIFASPSFAELEGMTVLEAMACGKPIIIPDALMNAAKYFVDGNGLLFETSNSKDLAEKIVTLINDIQLRKQMGEKSIENSKRYDIHTSVKKLEDLYESVLANSN